MSWHLKTSVHPFWGLVLVLLVACSSLRPAGEVRDEFLQDARFVLEQHGVALFGTPPPTLDDLRSDKNQEPIRRLVAVLDGPDSVSAEMLLSALAVLEGKRLAAELCSAFDQVTNRLAVHDLNVIVMKATGVRSVTIAIPETGETVRYRLWLGDAAFGYSQEESSGHSNAKPLSNEEVNLAFRKRSQQYWRERL